MYNYSAYPQAPAQSMNPMNTQQPTMSGSMAPPSQSMGNMSPMSSPQPQSFKRGGKVKMTPAHVSPEELDELDKIQGRVERTRHGVRTYPHIEELLSNPHLHAMVHHHARATHHAMGGDISPQEQHSMEMHGHKGDTSVALFGPRTHQLFHSMATGGAMNEDGHPEYWSLAGALRGLSGSIGRNVAAAGRGLATGAGHLASAAGRGAQAIGRGAVAVGKAAAPHVGSIIQGALPAVTDIAMQQLGDKLGPSGQILAGLGSNLAEQAANKLTGPNGGSQIGEAIGRGVGQFGTSANKGMSLRKAAGQGFDVTGQYLGGDETGAGQLAQSVGAGLQHGFKGDNSFGNRIAPQALTSGLGALAAGAQHRQAGNSLRSSLQAAGQSFLPQGHQLNHAANMNMDNFNELPFANHHQMAY